MTDIILSGLKHAIIQFLEKIPHSTKAIQAKGLKAKHPRCKRSHSRIVRKEYNCQSIFAKKKLKYNMKRYRLGKLKHTKKIIKEYPVRYRALHKKQEYSKRKQKRKFEN